MQKTAKKLLTRLNSLRLVGNAIEVSNTYTRMQQKLLISGTITGIILSIVFFISYMFLVKNSSIFDVFFIMFGSFFINLFSIAGMTGLFGKWSKKLLNRFSKKWSTTEKAYEDMIQEFSILLKTDSVFSQEIYTFLEDVITLSNIKRNEKEEKNMIIDDILNHRVSYLISRLDVSQKHLHLLANSDKQEEVNPALIKFKALNGQYRESIASELQEEKELSMGELKKYI